MFCASNATLAAFVFPFYIGARICEFKPHSVCGQILTLMGRRPANVPTPPAFFICVRCRRRRPPAAAVLSARCCCWIRRPKAIGILTTFHWPSLSFRWTPKAPCGAFSKLSISRQRRQLWYSIAQTARAIAVGFDGIPAELGADNKTGSVASRLRYKGPDVFEISLVRGEGRKPGSLLAKQFTGTSVLVFCGTACKSGGFAFFYKYGQNTY